MAAALIIQASRRAEEAEYAKHGWRYDITSPAQPPGPPSWLVFLLAVLILYAIVFIMTVR